MVERTFNGDTMTFNVVNCYLPFIYFNQSHISLTKTEAT